MKDKKIFSIFNTAAIGDILLNNGLCHNIKVNYPDSKIVYVVPPKLKDVAKYQRFVDDVVTFDKKTQGHSLKEIYKFVKNFPYKDIYASFVIYKNERNLVLSKLLGAKYIVSKQDNIFRFLHSKNYAITDYKSAKDESSAMIEALTGKPCEIVPIFYDAPEVSSPIVEYVKSLAKDKKLVAICTNSNFYKKDLPPKVAKELIEMLNKAGKKVLFLGAGAVAQSHCAQIRYMGCFDFVDLTDTTNFVELANVLKQCEALISVDTGTMHFATALQVPVASIFYEKTVEAWAPDKNLYPKSIVIDEEQSAEKIYMAYESLIK